MERKGSYLFSRLYLIIYLYIFSQAYKLRFEDNFPFSHDISTPHNLIIYYFYYRFAIFAAEETLFVKSLVHIYIL